MRADSRKMIYIAIWYLIENCNLQVLKVGEKV